MKHRITGPSEDSMTRRRLFGAAAGGMLMFCGRPSDDAPAGEGEAGAEGPRVQTVTGPVPASDLGVTLIHEHIVTDLRPPAERKAGDYDPEDAVRVALPFLTELRESGCRTLVEPTPILIGRDAVVLQRLSKESGLRIIAATGIYGAAEQKFIPDYAHTQSAEQLAAQYVQEAEQGIGSSGVRPGIIKTGVNAGTPLPEIERKLVRAAALAHKQTGLVVAAHTGPGKPALEELEIFDAVGAAPNAFIWVHAQAEKDHSFHLQVAKAGAWVEFDGVGPQSADWHLECLQTMKEAGLLHRTLISQDAGWYRPGAADQQEYRGYTYLFTDFLPLLRESGFEPADIDQLLVRNPARALAGLTA